MNRNPVPVIRPISGTAVEEQPLGGKIGIRRAIQFIAQGQQVVLGLDGGRTHDDNLFIGLYGYLNASVPPVPRTFEDGKTVRRIEGTIEVSLGRCQIPGRMNSKKNIHTPPASPVLINPFLKTRLNPTKNI